MKANDITAFGRFITDGFISIAGTWDPVLKEIFEKISHQNFTEVSCSNTGARCSFRIWEFYGVEIFSTRVFISFAPIIDFTIETIMIPKVFRP
jgi:hypothetical protein